MSEQEEKKENTNTSISPENIMPSSTASVSSGTSSASSRESLKEIVDSRAIRRHASLSGMDDKLHSSFNTQDAFDWGDLSLRNEQLASNRRTFFLKAASDGIAIDDSQRSILEKDILDESHVFPSSSVRYLPLILRESYAIRREMSTTTLGKAKLAQIDLRLRLRRPRKLPYFRDILGAILILDLSGFTALGERLRSELGPREGAAEFADKVNAILSSMVLQVYKHKGDVLMFAGDALICLFMETDKKSIDKSKTLQCVKNCCLNVLGEVATTSNGEFRVHGGASFGLVRCLYLGRHSNSPGDCAFVVSGKPLRRAGILLDASSGGEVHIEGLGKTDVMIVSEEDGKKTFHKTRRKKGSILSSQKIPNLVSLKHPKPVFDEPRIEHTGLSMEIIKTYDVHPYARAYISKLQARRGDFDSQNAMSILNNELRRVAIVFAGLRDLDNIDTTIQESIDLMNRTFISLSHITHNCNGAVRDMLVDDKGCVFIAVFGAHSHEIDPCFNATVCALRMQTALKALELKQFSLGVSYGDCFCGEVGPDVRSDFVVMGPEVNMAARLMAKAPNHGILVSKRIFSNSHRDIQFTKTSKELKVKGKNDSFHAYIPQSRKKRAQVLRRGSNRHLTTTDQSFEFIPSRKKIYNEIMEAVNCAKDGTPKLVFLVSAPFLGKSSIIDEVSNSAGRYGFKKYQSFRTQLDSHTSYFPFRQITSSALHECASLITNKEINDDVQAMSELMNQKILNKTDRVVIGSILASVIDPQLMSLFKGQNPASVLKSLIESLIKILQHIQPLMMVLDGDGELDPSSWNLLSELMKKAKIHCPNLFILVSFQEKPPIPVSAINLRSEVIQLDLAPLDENETEIFVKAVMGIRDQNIRISKELLNVVIDRSNGCLSFIDYIVAWAEDNQMFEYIDDGRMLTLKTIEEDSKNENTTIPRELTNIVLASFNDLPPVLWDALKIASCIGYSFDAAVYGELHTLDLIPRIRIITSKYDAFETCNVTRYKWKHQAVYESVKSLLMTQQRIHLHKVIVGAFENKRTFFANSPNLRDEVHRLLARHCSLAEMWENAFTQYIQAGEYAEQTYKFSEAAKMYEEAINGQSNLDIDALSKHKSIFPKIKLGACLKELARYSEAETTLTKCLEEADEDAKNGTGDEMMLVYALTALASLHQAQSNYSAAKNLYERAVPIARQMQNSPSSVWLAGIIAGYAETLRKSGDLYEAESMHREALDIRNRAVEENSCTELELAVSYTQLGCTLLSLESYEEAYDQHRSALNLRLNYLDFSHGLISESLNYCAESLCSLGRAHEAIPLSLHAVEIRKVVFGSQHPALAHALGILAWCYHKAGRSFDALGHIESCLKICESAFHSTHANLIPNLMNYGEILRSIGNYRKSYEVYSRAIEIHNENFEEGQNEGQLNKAREESEKVHNLLETRKLRKANRTKLESLMQNLPPYNIQIPQTDTDTTGSSLIISTDIGRDIDDELALVLLASLKKMCLLDPITVVTTLSPQKDRARLARGCLDSLGLVNVPVGVGSSGGVSEDVKLDFYGGDYAQDSHTICEDGIGLFVKALESSSPKTVQFLCLTSLTDVASLLRKKEDLFVEKVKEVVIMGGLKPLESSAFVCPDKSFNNKCDMTAAKFVYRKCQELGIPTVTISRWAAHGCPVPATLVDGLAISEHMIAHNIRNVGEYNLMKLSTLVNLPLCDSRRKNLPESCNREWFCQTFLGKNDLSEDDSLWSQVTKLTMYSPLALLACVPVFRENYFECKTKIVNDTQHSIIGTSIEDRGIIKSSILLEEFISLFRLGLKNSLKMI